MEPLSLKLHRTSTGNIQEAGENTALEFRRKDLEDMSMLTHRKCMRLRKLRHGNQRSSRQLGLSQLRNKNKKERSFRKESPVGSGVGW